MTENHTKALEMLYATGTSLMELAIGASKQQGQLFESGEHIRIAFITEARQCLVAAMRGEKEAEGTTDGASRSLSNLFS